jgi:hypothetical protein
MSNSPMIYEPKGRALEYAPLACNLAVGCPHNCRYCYGPASFHRKVEEWSTPRFKANALRRFLLEAPSYRDDPRPILFSFATDPCATPEAVELLRQVLIAAEINHLKVEVLTKNPEAAVPLFEVMARNGWGLGVTVCFLDETLRVDWEPNAPPIADRLAGLALAREAGVRTWVSVEPPVDPGDALRAISVLRDRVDIIKVGRWNHDKAADALDWSHFLDDAAALLSGRPHLFKVDLLQSAGYVPVGEGLWRRPGSAQPLRERE